MLQEEPEMQELKLQLDDTHKDDCKNPRETFTAGQRNILLLFYKQACDRESIIHSTTYYIEFT